MNQWGNILQRQLTVLMSEGVKAFAPKSSTIPTRTVSFGFVLRESDSKGLGWRCVYQHFSGSSPLDIKYDYCNTDSSLLVVTTEKLPYPLRRDLSWMSFSW